MFAMLRAVKKARRNRSFAQTCDESGIGFCFDGVEGLSGGIAGLTGAMVMIEMLRAVKKVRSKRVFA
jgi:hypothetical protein